MGSAGGPQLAQQPIAVLEMQYLNLLELLQQCSRIGGVVPILLEICDQPLL